MSFFKKLFKNTNTIMDWREFTEYFSQQIQQNIDGKIEIEWADDLENTTVHLYLNNGQQAGMYLGNHFIRYQNNPEDLPEIIEQTLAIVRQIGNDEREETQRDNIFPFIKHNEWVDTIIEAAQKEDNNPLQYLNIRQLAGDIWIIYMVDTGGSFRSLHRDEAEQLGIENDDMLHSLAIENLENYMRQEQNLGYRQSEEGLFQIYLDNVLDASLILLLEKIIDRTELDFSPYPVFAVPSRDMLLVCAANNKPALEQMQEMIENVMQDSAYCISEQIYCIRNGEIALFHIH